MIDDELYAAAEATLASLRARGLTCATAESCTGGLIAAALTAVPGSSDVFLGGFVTYSNAMKRDILGVSQADLDAYGAVSEPVARAMADGARARSGADVAVSVTGVAGPGGGTMEKPIGLVWFAVCVQREATADKRMFGGGRTAIRQVSADHSLTLLREEGRLIQTHSRP